MRSKRLAAAALTALALAAGTGAAQELNSKQRAVVQSLKSYAESKPGMVNRIQQGSFYFKWLQAAPPGWDKAYFKLGETDKGKFLSLQLIKRVSQGVELMIVNDRDLNFAPEEAFHGTGRTLADADKAIAAAGLEKSKVALSPELTTDFASALDQLRWELAHP